MLHRRTNCADRFFFSQRIFTEADIYDSHIYATVSDYICSLEDFIRAHNIELEPDVDIVFDILLSSQETLICNYYLVSHAKRAIFWLDKVEASDFYVWEEVKGIKSTHELRTHLLSAAVH